MRHRQRPRIRCGLLDACAGFARLRLRLQHCHGQHPPIAANLQDVVRAPRLALSVAPDAPCREFFSDLRWTPPGRRQGWIHQPQARFVLVQRMVRHAQQSTAAVKRRSNYSRRMIIKRRKPIRPFTDAVRGAQGETVYADSRDVWDFLTRILASPSRTADIERSLTIGVQGPSRLTAAVLTDKQP